MSKFNGITAFRNYIEMQRLLSAAKHALRSYQNGNSAPDLAKEVADEIESFQRREVPAELEKSAVVRP